MKWVGLFIVAVVSTIVVGVPLFIWANVKFAFTWEWGMLTQYYKQATVGVDKLDARLGKVAFDDLLIEKNGEEFGSKDEDGDETISDNIGDNKKKNALTRFGIRIAKGLNWIDKDHVEKASSIDK